MVHLGAYGHSCYCTSCTGTRYWSKRDNERIAKEKAIAAAQDYSDTLDSGKSAEESAVVFDPTLMAEGYRKLAAEGQWDAGKQRAQKAIETLKKLEPRDIDYIRAMDCVTFAEGVTLPSGRCVTSEEWEALKIQVQPTEGPGWKIVSREEVVKQEIAELEAKEKARKEEEKRLAEEKEAAAILKAGTPPAWDPLGVAPFAWHLPAPRPLPLPLTRGQKFREFKRPLTTRTYLYASLVPVYLGLAVMQICLGHAIAALVNLAIALIWTGSTTLTIKGDRRRYRLELEEDRRRELQ